jgi:hypothetical protein
MSTPNPLDVLEKAITYGIALDAHPRSVTGKPGAVIQRMSKEDREALSKLTSDQAANMRVVGR